VRGGSHLVSGRGSSVEVAVRFVDENWGGDVDFRVHYFARVFEILCFLLIVFDIDIHNSIHDRG
jgi:hypothetical protein